MYALTYAKYTSGQDKYNEYAQGQMDYLLGNNPANRSYLIGFGDSYPQHIHHRAANPDKGTAKYTLYGTLVGGPTDANGSYDDNTDSYSCTEPALDYNGCFALAIAGLYAVYGGSTTAAQSAIASASEINSDFVFSYGGGGLLSPAQPRPRSRPRPQQKRQQRQQKLPQQRTLPRHRIRWQRGKRYRIL